MIYLDYAATTPMSETALQMYGQAAKSYFANASSLHDGGTMVAEVLATCRQQQGLLIGADPEGIHFTSGGSEANIYAILSLLKANKQKGNHLITTKIEHASLDNLFHQLEREGYEVTYLPLDENGIVCLDRLTKSIKSSTVLASIHHGNSEVGILQPINEIGAILADNDVLFHTDCVQTFCELPIDVKKSKIDSLSVSSHKVYGPKGCGFSYIAPGIGWKPVYEGTSHEGGFKPGTVDLPSIVAFTAAAQEMIANQASRIEKYQSLRQIFTKELADFAEEIIVEESAVGQLPQIIGLSFTKVQGQHIMLECNRRDIHISTGSACQVGMRSPSRTMLALGKTAEQAKQFVRISLGDKTNASELKQAAKVLKEITSKIP